MKGQGSGTRVWELPGFGGTFPQNILPPVFYELRKVSPDGLHYYINLLYSLVFRAFPLKKGALYLAVEKNLPPKYFIWCVPYLRVWFGWAKIDFDEFGRGRRIGMVSPGSKGANYIWWVNDSEEGLNLIIITGLL